MAWSFFLTSCPLIEQLDLNLALYKVLWTLYGATGAVDLFLEEIQLYLVAVVTVNYSWGLGHLTKS